MCVGIVGVLVVGVFRYIFVSSDNCVFVVVVVDVVNVVRERSVRVLVWRWWVVEWWVFGLSGWEWIVGCEWWW